MLNQILDFIKNNMMLIILSNAAITVIMFLLLLVALIKQSNLKKKYNNFMSRLGQGANFEQMLSKYIDDVKVVEGKIKETRNNLTQVERTIIKCVQKVGVVRYNAFADTGSNLSFAIALLDANDDGIIFNGIYSREGTATYAKPVEKGTSKHPLSAEEIMAIDEAKKTKSYPMPIDK